VRKVAAMSEILELAAGTSIDIVDRDTANVLVARVTVPPGALRQAGDDAATHGTLSVAPVADSQVADVVEVPSNWRNHGSGLRSPPFHATVDASVAMPFEKPIEFRAPGKDILADGSVVFFLFFLFIFFLCSYLFLTTQEHSP
jgi:hypothetical protein